MIKKDRSSLELMVNGKLTNNPADVAEALNYYFVDSVVTISQYFPLSIQKFIQLIQWNKPLL